MVKNRKLILSLKPFQKIKMVEKESFSTIFQLIGKTLPSIILGSVFAKYISESICYFAQSGIIFNRINNQRHHIGSIRGSLL